MTDLPARPGSLMGWDPFRMMREMMRWSQRLDEDFPSYSQESAFLPALEVKETDDAYEVQADVPGLKPEDIDISVSGNRLTLSGRRVSESRNDNERFHAYERSYGSFTRSFTLPDGANLETVDATLQNGVLRLTVPKRPEVQSRRVEVKNLEAGGGEPKQLRQRGDANAAERAKAQERAPAPSR